MPLDADGSLRNFTQAEIDAMEIETFGVRDQSHPTETREVDQVTQVRTYFCKWSERYNFLELVLGRVTTYDDGTFRLSRLLPHVHYGRHHTIANVIATKLEEMTGHGRCSGEDSNHLPEYPRAKCRFLYELVPFELAIDTDVTGAEFLRYVIPPREADSEGEYTTMPGGILHYIRTVASGTGVPHGKPVPFNMGLVTPTQKRTWTWVRVPKEAFEPLSPLHERIFVGDGDERPFVGTVNKEDFDGYPMGTLLFEGVHEQLKRDAFSGEWVYDLGFKFNYRPQGWNWLPYFDTDTTSSANGVYFIGKDDTHYYSDTLPDSYSLYDARDHNLLFQVS